MKYRTTTVMVVIAHPVVDHSQVVADAVQNAVLRTAEDWGIGAVSFVAGPEIVVTDEGSGEPDIPVWEPGA